MIIDVYRHFAPKDLFESFGALNKPPWRYQDPTLEFTFYHKLYEIDVQLRDMDEAGIDIAVLSLAQLSLMIAALNAYRHDRIIFGTDYPMEFHTGEDKKWFIENIKTMENLTRRIKKTYLVVIS